MPKRPCTDRAKWRLLRGKPPHPLPAHYQLDCDYGTPVLTIYREGEGDTPTYLCELHAAAERDIAATPRTPRRSVGDDNFDGEATVRFSEIHSAADSLPDRDDRISPLDAPADALHKREPIPHLDAAAPNPAPPAAPAPRTAVAPARPAAAAPPPTMPTPIVTAPIVPAPKPKVLSPERTAPAPAPSTISQPPTDSAPSLNVPVAQPTASAPTDSVRRPAPPAAKLPPPKSNSTSKAALRDLAYGNPAKALVDETIWNLQPGDYDAYRAALRQGKSAAEAAQAAGGQLAVVHRKIHEYAARIDALLAASNAAINVDGAIHTLLESETLKIIADGAMADEQKDAALARLGDFQEWINRSLEPAATPLKAHQLALAIADRANWGAASASVPNELKSAYRAVYSSLRNAIHAAIPDVHDADDRLVNLYAAKSDLDASLHAETTAPAHALTLASSTVTPASEEKLAV